MRSSTVLTSQVPRILDFVLEMQCLHRKESYGEADEEHDEDWYHDEDSESRWNASSFASRLIETSCRFGRMFFTTWGLRFLLFARGWMAPSWLWIWMNACSVCGEVWVLQSGWQNEYDSECAVAGNYKGRDLWWGIDVWELRNNSEGLKASSRTSSSMWWRTVGASIFLLSRRNWVGLKIRQSVCRCGSKTYVKVSTSRSHGCDGRLVNAWLSCVPGWDFCTWWACLLWRMLVTLTRERCKFVDVVVDRPSWCTSSWRIRMVEEHEVQGMDKQMTESTVLRSFRLEFIFSELSSYIPFLYNVVESDHLFQFFFFSQEYPSWEVWYLYLKQSDVTWKN